MSREKIVEITECDFNFDDDCKYPCYTGVIIKTNKQDIKIGIDNQDHCYETWGFISSEDEYTNFINSEILNIYLTDTELKSYLFAEGCFDYGGGMIFFNIDTTKGTLQFVAYNGHNGYYGHDVQIESKQLTNNDNI